MTTTAELMALADDFAQERALRLCGGPADEKQFRTALESALEAVVKDAERGPAVAYAVYVDDEKMKVFETQEEAAEWVKAGIRGGSPYTYHLRSLHEHPAAPAIAM